MLLSNLSSPVGSPGGSVTSDPQQLSAVTSPTATSFVRGSSGMSSWRVVPHTKQPAREQAKQEEDEEEEKKEGETAVKRKSKLERGRKSESQNVRCSENKLD